MPDSAAHSLNAPHRWLGVGVLLLLGGVLLAVLWPRGEMPPGKLQVSPVDPRREYTGPYRNSHPDVAYVGDAACRDCHRDIASTYAHHPMGRSLIPLREAAAAMVGEGCFQALGWQLQASWQEKKYLHHLTLTDDNDKPLDTLTFEIAYVIGSGTRGHSYLAQREGRLFQTPISWFSQAGIWNLSPGFTSEMARGRPISPDCLYCHANQTRPIEGTVNAYHTPAFVGHAIGCERCHGPGELHVRYRREGQPLQGRFDPTIVNPGKLPVELREAVCQQCHLAGEIRVPRPGLHLDDYRPGLPLEAFLSILVPDRADGHRKAVNHVEQMLLSRCFEKSPADNKLGCTSCHDAHQAPPPEQRLSFYRDRCLSCHREQGCSLPLEVRQKNRPENDCIACHMPRYSASDIPHVAATDHRIVRRPDPIQASPATDRLPVLFGRSNEQDDATLARDRGIGLAKLAASGKGDPIRYARHALELLDSSPAIVGDLSALESRGQALVVLGQPEKALAVFEAVLQTAPQRESALHAAALLAQQLDRREQTLDYWRRAVALNPVQPDYRANLATLLAQQRLWDEAYSQTQEWLRLDPASRPARELWVRCLRQKGQHDLARIQQDILRRLR